MLMTELQIKELKNRIIDHYNSEGKTIKFIEFEETEYKDLNMVYVLDLNKYESAKEFYEEHNKERIIEGTYDCLSEIVEFNGKVDMHETFYEALFSIDYSVKARKEYNE